MKEDGVLEKSIQFFKNQGWVLIYQTRSLSEGAIGGVDAILLLRDPLRLIFVDAKGETSNSVKRSTDFTNALGALVKRIRFERGYSTVEDIKRYLSIEGLKPVQVRDLVKKHGVHRNSEYVLAVDPSMKETIKSALDPSLAGLLHIRILLVDEESVGFFQW